MKKLLGIWLLFFTLSQGVVALRRAIAQSDFSIGEVVCGTARGVDTLGELWAAEHNVRKFPANWGRFGRAAGMYGNG